MDVKGTRHGPTQTGSDPVRVRLLGGFKVSVGSREVEEGVWRLRKATALIKLLALIPAHALHREQMMETLWPGAGRRASSNNLRQVLHAARGALHPDPVVAPRLLASSGERLVLCPEGNLWVDAKNFEEAASGARRAKKPAAYEAALELYAGELLPEDRYEEWAEEPRARLRGTYLSLLSELAALHEGRGNLGSAEEALGKLLMEEPTREGAHASLMRIYALWGGRGEALSQYERLENILARHRGAEPSASTRALREEITSGRYPPQGAPRDPGPQEEGSLRHNIPFQRTSFVGWERELLEAKRDLASTRLLTLTGMGGSGKTRLAMEVARSLAGAYPDGVWMTELASLSRGELVSQEVARAMGVREQPGKPLEKALAQYLRDKVALLLLDNCEHLLEACARLSDQLLGACPHLKILTTSREPLGVEGEVVWQVPPLPVPQTHSTADELTDFASVRLFVERARLKLPAFALTAANARAVSEVCQALEGVPLAVELAAARMGAIAAEQLAERLDDTLALLSSGPRSVSPRHRTMRATLEWSYELLSENERAAFQRLSVFAGGLTLEAAEAVVPGKGVTRKEVLGLVAALVEKSLLVAEILPGQQPRYRMLEPVRQYAWERLEEGKEAEATREAHVAFFLELAEEAKDGLVEPKHQGWLRRLEAEHDNLRGALSWSLDEGDAAELGLRLAGALWFFWYTRGHLTEGRGWLEKALRRIGAPVKTMGRRVRAEALEGAGYIAFFQGDYAAAKAFSEEGLTLYRELHEEEGIASCLTNLGFVATLGQRDDVPTAEVLREALDLRPRLRNRRTIGWMLILAGLFSVLGHSDLEEGKRLHEEALALFRKINDAQGTCLCLYNLGLLATGRGDYARATALLKELSRLARKMGYKLGTLHALFGLACVSASEGKVTRAACLWGAAEAAREADDLHITPAAYASVGYEDWVAKVRVELGEAAFARAWAEGKAMPPETAVGYALIEEAGPAAATPTGTPQKEPAAATRQALTRREKEVTNLVMRGYTNRRIAEELHLSERTVATHVGRVLKKLGVCTRGEVADRIAGDI